MSLPENLGKFLYPEDKRDYPQYDFQWLMSPRQFSNWCIIKPIECYVRDYEWELCEKLLLELCKKNGERVWIFSKIEDLWNGYLACKWECKENKLNNYRKFYDEYWNSMLNEEVYFYKNFEWNLYLNFSYYNDDIYQMVNNLFNRIYPKEYYWKFDSKKWSKLTPIGFEFHNEKKSFVITDQKNNEYYWLWPFENGRMLVINWKWYYWLINENFEWVISWKQEIWKLVNGFRIIKCEWGGLCFMDNDGNIVGKYYEAARDFSNGFAAVKNYRNDRWFIDSNWNFITNGFEFNEVSDFTKNRAKVKKIIWWITFEFFINNKWEYLLDDLKVLGNNSITDEQKMIFLNLSKNYKDIKIISNDVYAVKSNNTEECRLLVDENWNKKSDNNFLEIRDESEGLLAVSFYVQIDWMNKKVRNYIDTRWDLLNSKKYIIASDFENGRAYVNEWNWNTYYINKSWEKCSE